MDAVGMVVGGEVVHMESKLLKIKLRYWWGLLVILLFLILHLSLLSLFVRRWVEQGSNTTHWKGGLMACSTCGGEWKEMYYNNIYEDFCENNEYEGYCDTFNNLNIAGIIYILLEVVSLLGLFVWIFKVGLNYTGFFYNRTAQPLLDKRKVIYLVIIICIGLHTAALIFWFIIVQPKFSRGSCLETSEESEKAVCATFGPVISLIVVFMYVFSAIVYIFFDFKDNIVYATPEYTNGDIELDVIKFDN